jgi:hypothetical protein
MRGSQEARGSREKRRKQDEWAKRKGGNIEDTLR